MRPEGFWGALLCGLLQVAPQDHTSPVRWNRLVAGTGAALRDEARLSGETGSSAAERPSGLGPSASPGGGHLLARTISISDR